VREIRRAIKNRELAVLFPSSAPWASKKRVEAIRNSLTPDEQRSLMTFDAAQVDNPRSLLSVLALADRVVSVEGGLSHLALSCGVPVDIIRCKGSGPTLMWLPEDRAPEQFERTLLQELEFRERECSEVELDSAIANYLERNRSILSTGQHELKEFIANPGRLSPTVKLKEGAEEGAQESIDRAVRSFLGSLPGSEMLRLFSAKWKLPERQRALKEFFERMNFTSDLPLEMRGVRDLNSGRARHAGHFVYRLDFECGDAPISVYCKGHTETDHCPVRKYPGWENRPNFHLYESFFWEACRASGLACRQSMYFEDKIDGACIGFTLSEEIPGESSDRLIVEIDGKPAIRPEMHRYLPSLASQLGRWCALMELLRGGDRRVANLEGSYERPANYLVSLSSAGPFITGIDHELLFCKDPCLSYDRRHGANESFLMRALPEGMRPGFGRAFARGFLSAWREMTGPVTGAVLSSLVRDTFGGQSEEFTVFEEARRQDPSKLLQEVLEIGGAASIRELPNGTQTSLTANSKIH
jgi:hypothetical protein